jgi:multidrug efflux pump subunit AcrA (membrane-fusion protein)
MRFDSLKDLSRRSTFWVFASVAALAVLLGWRYARGPDVLAVAAQRGTAVEIVYATGGVEPVRWAKVASLIRDRIVEICDCEGTARRRRNCRNCGRARNF